MKVVDPLGYRGGERELVFLGSRKRRKRADLFGVKEGWKEVVFLGYKKRNEADISGGTGGGSLLFWSPG